MSTETIDISNIRHIAIIMDGNRRWAKLNKKRGFGHEVGVETLVKISKYLKNIGIEYLTVYAFSRENWKRTEEEIGLLMKLFKEYAGKIINKSVEGLEDVRIKFIGSKDKLNAELLDLIDNVEEKTKNNSGLNLDVCFNYSGRQEIVDAAKRVVNDISNGVAKLEDINEDTFKNYLYDSDAPYPDLVIRTGGELRLSNFLLWQVGYAEFYSTAKYWPDFSEEDVDIAIADFNNRKRRLGK